jgi:hypothetical protein
VASILQDNGQDVARLELSRQVSAGVKPDAAARVLRLEAQTGLPGDFIAQDVDEIERRVSDKNFSAEELRKSSPNFAAWLASNPNHYALAKEDVGFFGGIEKSARAFKEGYKSVPLQEELADLLNDDMDGRLTPAGSARMQEIDKVLGEQGRRAGALDNTLDYAARQVGYTGRQMGSTIIAGAKGAAAGFSAGAIYGTAVAPGLGSAAGAALGAEAGGLSAAWLYSYRMERAFAYKELRGITDVDGKPMDAATARLVATGVGIINGAIEVGSDVVLVKMVPGLNRLFSGGKALVRQEVKAALMKPTLRTALLSGFGKLASTGVKGGAVEGLEEISQALVGSVGREAGQAIAPGQAFAPDSAMQDVKDAGRQGLDAFVGTALTFGVGVGGAHFVMELRAAKAAAHAENFALALGGGVDSQAFKNLPEKAQEAVREIVKDGPLKTAYIDTQSWTEFFQKAGVDPREAAAEVLGDPKAYDEAVKNGHELAVPMENYARKIAVNPEANKFFSQELRSRARRHERREARVLFQKIEEEGKLMSADEHFEDPNAARGSRPSRRRAQAAQRSRRRRQDRAHASRAPGRLRVPGAARRHGPGTALLALRLEDQKRGASRGRERRRVQAGRDLLPARQARRHRGPGRHTAPARDAGI